MSTGDKNTPAKWGITVSANFYMTEATHEQAVKFTERVKSELILQFGPVMDQENFFWEIDEVLPAEEVQRKLQQQMDKMNGISPLQRGMMDGLFHTTSDGKMLQYKEGMFSVTSLDFYYGPPDPTTRQPDPVDPNLATTARIFRGEYEVTQSPGPIGTQGKATFKW